MIILNFHGVGPVLRSIDPGERNCWLEQEDFEAALDLAKGQAHVQLTFDDGNASDVELALPALLRRDLRATFFVCSSRLDQPAFLSRAHIRELRARGMDVGSHGAAHVSWRHLTGDRLVEEIEGSRRVLEEACGAPVDAAACPFGAYDRTVLSALRRAGYRRVYTSDGGNASEHQWIRARTTVTRSMPPDAVRRLIQQGPGPWEQASIDIRTFIKRIR